MDEQKQVAWAKAQDLQKKIREQSILTAAEASTFVIVWPGQLRYLCSFGAIQARPSCF